MHASDTPPGQTDAVFDDAFFRNVPEDAIDGLLYVCDAFGVFDNAQPEVGMTSPEKQEKITARYLEALGLLRAYIETKEIQVPFNLGEIRASHAENVNGVQVVFRDAKEFALGRLSSRSAATSLRQATDRFIHRFGRAFTYQFSRDDLRRVQEILNALRTLIADSDVIEADHKRRLLRRLERLQAEMHKEVSDLDRFWGLVVEGGVMLKKFGKDVKPIVDRVTEIARIVWRVQASAERLTLPDPRPPLLPDDKPEGEALSEST